MNKPFQKIKKIVTLDPEKKAVLWQSIEKDIHSFEKNVRIDSAVRLTWWEWKNTSQNLYPNRKNMLVTIITGISILFAGGASFAAESSLPWDMLYGIKVNINEQIQSAFTFWAEAEAELQISRVEERIEERNTLEAQWNLNSELDAQIAAQILAHSEVFQKENKKLQEQESSSESSVTTELKTSSILETRLSSLIGIYNSQSSVDAQIKTESSTSSSVNDNQGNVDSSSQVEINVSGDTENEIDTIIDSVSEIETNIEAEINSWLDTVIDIQAQWSWDLDDVSESTIEFLNAISTDQETQLESSTTIDSTLNTQESDTLIDSSSSLQNTLNIR